MSFAKLAQIFFFYADNDMIYQACFNTLLSGDTFVEVRQIDPWETFGAIALSKKIKMASTALRYTFEVFEVHCLLDSPSGMANGIRKTTSLYWFGPQGIHCMPRTSDLNEELGQVEYVFSATWYKLWPRSFQSTACGTDSNPSSPKGYTSSFLGKSPPLCKASFCDLSQQSCQVSGAAQDKTGTLTCCSAMKMYGEVPDCDFKLLKLWEFRVFERVQTGSRGWFLAIVSELLPGNVMDFRKFCVKGITYGQACGCDEGDNRSRSNFQIAAPHAQLLFVMPWSSEKWRGLMYQRARAWRRSRDRSGPWFALIPAFLPSFGQCHVRLAQAGWPLKIDDY